MRISLHGPIPVLTLSFPPSLRAWFVTWRVDEGSARGSNAKGFFGRGPYSCQRWWWWLTPRFLPEPKGCLLTWHFPHHPTKIINVCCCSINQQCELSFFIVFSFSKITRWYPFRKKQASKNFKLFLFKFGDTPLRGEGVHKGLFGKSLPHACYAKNWLFSRIFLFSRWMVGYDTIRTYDCGFVSQMSAGAPDAINTWIPDCFVFSCTVQKNESAFPPILPLDRVCVLIRHEKSLNFTHVLELSFRRKLGTRETSKKCSKVLAKLIKWECCIFKEF